MIFTSRPFNLHVQSNRFYVYPSRNVLASLLPHIISGKSTGYHEAKDIIDLVALTDQDLATHDPPFFQPSAASILTQTMAIWFSFFYPNSTIDKALLRQSLISIQQELPMLGGRVQVVNGGKKLADTRIALLGLNKNDSQEVKERGIEVVYKNEPFLSLQDLGPETWTGGMAGRRLLDFPVPFYAPKFDVNNLLAGKEAVCKVTVLHCCDGVVVTFGFSHMLADAGRAIKICSRIAHYYKEAAAADAHDGGGGIAISSNTSTSSSTTTTPSPPLTAAPELETPQGYMNVLKDGSVPPDTIASLHQLDTSLSLQQQLLAPIKIVQFALSKHEVHLIHLPAAAVHRLKTIASPTASGQDTPTEKTNINKIIISNMDAVQAFLVMLKSNLQGKSLVPKSPSELTVNIDILHGLEFKDKHALESCIGNFVVIKRMNGVSNAEEARPWQEKKEEEEKEATNIDTSTIANNDITCTSKEQEEKHLSMIEWCLQRNAQLIRRGIQTFRSNPQEIIQELHNQSTMAGLSKMKLLSNFIIKGSSAKVSSTSAISAFSFDEIDFGDGGPAAVQFNIHPRFDWWTLIQGISNTNDKNNNNNIGKALPGGGVLCYITTTAGLGDSLVNSPILKHLTPEATVIKAQSRDKVDAELDRRRALNKMKAEKGREEGFIGDK